jgi:hypothetical protein
MEATIYYHILDRIFSSMESEYNKLIMPAKLNKRILLSLQMAFIMLFDSTSLKNSDNNSVLF